MRRLFLSLLCVLWAGTAMAVDTTTTTASPDFMGDILGLLRSALADTGALKTAGYGLLFPLMIIEAHRQGIQILIGGREMQDVFASIIRLMLVGTLFAVFIQYSDYFLKGIIKAFQLLGMNMTGIESFDALTLLQMGIAAASKVVGSVGVLDALSHPIIVLTVLFAAVCLLVAFIVAGVQLLMAQVEAMIIIAVAPLVFGFGGLKFTRDMASKPFNHAIAIGVKLITISILCVVLTKFGQELTTFLQKVENIENNLGLLFELTGTGIFLIMLSFMVPSLASSMISGVSSMVASQAMAAGASAAGGAASAAGAALTAGTAAVSGGASLAAGAASNLGGVMQAARAGMEAAGDLGKTGLSAAAHAGGEMASHGASVLGGKARDMATSAAQSAGYSPGSTLGGQVADSINASRGGALSPASGGGSTGGSNGGGAGTSGGSSSGSPTAGTSMPSNAGYSESSSSASDSGMQYFNNDGTARPEAFMDSGGTQKDLGGYVPSGLGDAGGVGLTAPGDAASGAAAPEKPGLIDRVKSGLDSVSSMSQNYHHSTAGFDDRAQVAPTIDTRGD